MPSNLTHDTLNLKIAFLNSTVIDTAWAPKNRVRLTPISFAAICLAICSYSRCNSRSKLRLSRLSRLPCICYWRTGWALVAPPIFVRHSYLKAQLKLVNKFGNLNSIKLGHHISLTLIPAIIGKDHITDQMRHIFSMPAKYGGLGILEPESICSLEYESSIKATCQLTNAIFSQQQILKIDEVFKIVLIYST